MVFDQVILHCGIFSHLVHAFSCLSPTILLTLSSSMPAQTSSWIRWRLFLPWALLTWVFEVSQACQLPWCPPCLFLRHDSATSTAFSTLHFLPGLTSMPADDTFWSLESKYRRDYFVHATINSSVRLLNGSCKMLVVLYSAALLRLRERPSHLQRKLLIFLSRDLTVVTVTT